MFPSNGKPKSRPINALFFSGVTTLAGCGCAGCCGCSTFFGCVKPASSARLYAFSTVGGIIGSGIYDSTSFVSCTSCVVAFVFVTSACVVWTTSCCVEVCATASVVCTSCVATCAVSFVIFVAASSTTTACSANTFTGSAAFSISAASA